MATPKVLNMPKVSIPKVAVPAPSQKNLIGKSVVRQSSMTVAKKLLQGK